MFSVLCRKLLTDAELLDDSSVTVNILLGEVVEKVSSLTYHHLKTSSGMEVLGVNLKMLGKVSDLFGKDSDLNFGRTGIVLVNSVLVNKLTLEFFFHVFHLIKYISFSSNGRKSFVRPDSRPEGKVNAYRLAFG